MRRTLPRKKARKILEILGIKRGKVDVIEEKGFNIYFVDDLPLLVERKGKVVKSITYFIKFGISKYVKVDKGAVEKILSGADVLRPGIVEYSEFSEGDSVLIVGEDERVIGVGFSLVSSKDLESIKRGKVLKNVYTIRDKIWRIERSTLKELGESRKEQERS